MNEALQYIELAELECAKADLMLESFEDYNTLEGRAAELRNYLEGDLGIFDEDAQASTTEKKKGLIGKAWDALKTLFQTIKDKLMSVFDKGIKDDEVGEIPAEYADKQNISKLKKAVDKVKSIGTSTPAKVIIATAALVGTAVAAYKGVETHKAKKTLGVTGKQLKQLLKMYETNVKGLLQGIEQCKRADQTMAEKAAFYLKAAGNNAVMPTLQNALAANAKQKKVDISPTKIFATLRANLGQLGTIYKDVSSKLLKSFKAKKK